MEITYKSRSYSPDLVDRRYVRKGSYAYYWCEVDKTGRDIRQGTVDKGDAPASIIAEADKLHLQAYGWVKWPMGADSAGVER